MSSDILTSAGEAYIIDAIDTAIGTGAAFQTGEGTTDAAKGDTALEDPIGTRTGTVTKSQPSADVLRFVKLISYTASAAVTELGLFADASAGPLLQRHTFGALNVENGDALEFTIEHEQA